MTRIGPDLPSPRPAEPDPALDSDPGPGSGADASAPRWGRQAPARHRGRRPPSWRRRLVSGLRVLLATVVAVAALFGAGIPLYVAPPSDPLPEHADVVFVLGPSTRGRVEYARRLIDFGVVDRMVLSVGPDEMAAPYEEKKYKKCNEPGGDVTCFAADPNTTQGEARALRDMAEENGWESVVVMTQAPHLVRARFILDRCYSGEMAMIPSPEPIGLEFLVYQYFYQTGAFLKAFFVTTTC